MALYQYKCPDCGPFDTVHPMGAAPQQALCPSCGGGSSRVFSPPMLTTTSPRLNALLSQEEKSREAPDVVRGVPPARGRAPAPPSNPLHAQLPKP